MHHPSGRWINKLGRDNVHVVATGELFADMPTKMRQVYSFLGLSDFTPEPLPVSNKNSIDAPLETESARQMLSDFYHPWNAELYELLGRELNWS